MPVYTAPLSIMDNMMPFLHTTMWLSFSTQDPDSATDALRKGLARTVAKLPFLGGQVYEDPEHGNRATITWSDENPTITLEETDGTGLPSYSALAANGMNLHSLQHDFCPPTLKASMQAKRGPALIVSYTKIEGGLIVMLAPSHQIMDGGGRAILFSVLAQMTKGEDPSIAIDPQEPLTRVSRLATIIGSTAESLKRSDIPTREQSPQVNHALCMSPDSTPVIRKLVCLSVRKLEILRQVLRQHTKFPFTLNTMMSSLMWTLLSLARVQRFQTADPDFGSKEVWSELTLAVNGRSLFEKASILQKDSWLGNLSIAILPHPRINLSSLNDSKFDIEVNTGSASTTDKIESESRMTISCSKIIPEIIDMITRGLSNLTTASFCNLMSGVIEQVSMAPNFDYRQLRHMPDMFNGVNMMVTNWGALDLLPDFGPNLGRPTHPRLIGGGFDGACIMLPRHRSSDCDPELLDRFDIALSFREDDMQTVLSNDMLQAVMKEPAN